MKQGIDISEHNRYVDFKKVKQAGYDFVIIRLGWIGNLNNHTLDKYFEEYYSKAKEAGLQVGVYVYSYCKSIDNIKKGANWTIDKLKGKTLEFPVFLDLEDETIIGCGKKNLTNQAKEFSTIIKQAGLQAGIYANLNWFNNYLEVNELLNYKIWLAQYTNNQNHGAKFKVDMWQYTSKGNINGISGNVDLNKCLNCENKSEEEITGKKEEYDVKIYMNGTTKEIVYQDSSCKNQIGYLNPHEIAECYGIVDNKALIVYNVDKTNYKKVGFVKWLGGIK